MQDLRLVPVFRAKSGGPRFRATYRNETDSDVSPPCLLLGSLLILNGDPYSRTGIKYGGSLDLGPGGSWEFTFGVSEYGATGALATGRNTLVLRLGGVEFGPVEFEWVPEA
jgi:hypothetical protein